MALAKSWEMIPDPAIPQRVGSNADIFKIFVQVSQRKNNPDTTRGGQANIFFQSANPKTANSWARSSRSSKSANCKSADFYGLYSQNSPKSRIFKQFFVMYKSKYAKFVRGKGMHLRTCGSFKFAYQKINGFVNRKSAKGHICGRSSNLTNYLNSQICGFAICCTLDHPTLETTNFFVAFLKEIRSGSSNVS